MLTQKIARQHVLQALKLLGLRSGTTANCKVLSREMQITIGKRLSPITLYRMLYPEKYGVIPYKYSVDILEEFLETIERSVQKKEGVKASIALLSYVDPEETALYKMLNLLLIRQEADLIGNFIEDLPIEHMALGWERHIIGKTLGMFFGNYLYKSEFSRTMHLLLTFPKIRTYYFETYVDYNHGLRIFGCAAQQLLEYQQASNKPAFLRILTKDDEQSIASYTFTYLMLHYFAWLSLDDKLQKTYWHYLNDPAVREYLQHSSTTFPYVRMRYESAKIIEHCTSLKNLMPGEPAEWVELLNGLFIGCDPTNREFGAVILCDTLILLGHRDLLKQLLIAFPSNTYLDTTVPEPVYIRYKLYNQLCRGAKDLELSETLRTSYMLGWGEAAYHELIMTRAMKLFGRKYFSDSNHHLLIQQTGFLRFDT